MSLHSVRIEGTQVVVEYSKDLDTCGHLITPSYMVVHRINWYCDNGQNITIKAPLSDFTGVSAGVQLKLCHGNNYNICSNPVTVTEVEVPPITLHSVRIEGTQLVVEYSKTFFDTCAHLLTPPYTIVHRSNYYCAGGQNIIVKQPLSEFIGVQVGTQLKLCHGNNYNICSNLVSVGGQPPASSAWALTGGLAGQRQLHTLTLLKSGKALVAGGYNRPTEVYDPASGTWTTSGSLVTDHRYHTATLLDSGKVLVAGGEGTSSADSAELYDPASGTWSGTGSLVTNRSYHAAVLLTDGRVLVMGGTDAAGTVLASAEVYDPASGTWSATAAMQANRYLHTATRLANGKVLVTGGRDTSGVSLFSAEVFDPATGTWTAVGGMATARRYHTATLLGSGKVLVTGGYDDSTGISTSTELYDPATGAWSSGTAMRVNRYLHAAALLPGGKVLVAGGTTTGDPSSAELYTPGN
ncbi:Kelch repeat-containing protein [Archangium sp.]|uniref:Kelch repeat-containing protein n=1 Tax=Archangium sp. TaxID=1872627 RepID=UPI00389A8831